MYSRHQAMFGFAIPYKPVNFTRSTRLHPERTTSSKTRNPTMPRPIPFPPKPFGKAENDKIQILLNMVIRFLVSTSSSPASSAAAMHSHKLIVVMLHWLLDHHHHNHSKHHQHQKHGQGSSSPHGCSRHLNNKFCTTHRRGLTRTTITEPCRSTAQQSAEPVLPARLQECKRASLLTARGTHSKNILAVVIGVICGMMPAGFNTLGCYTS